MSPTPLRMLQKAVRDPRRALLRLVLNSRLARRNARLERRRFLEALSRRWNVDANALSADYRGSEFARWYKARREELGSWTGELRMGTSGNATCEALYVLVRAARPRIVVETGVLYGGSSAHILAALAANGAGELHSIDLGCGPGEPPQDFLVHPDLMRRWEYVRGDIRRELPRVLERLGRIDLFHHDSLHTYEHMTWEYETAARHLGPGGVLSSHDVLVADGFRGIFRENAFPDFCRRWGFQFTIVGNSGVAARPELVPQPRERSLTEPGPRVLTARHGWT